MTKLTFVAALTSLSLPAMLWLTGCSSESGNSDISKNASAIGEVERIRTVANDGPFQATWDSLATYEIPEWYQDAKFGIFIHWGVYSVPAWASEWYPRFMYVADHENHQHHTETYGSLEEFGYKDFIPQLTFENYDPAAYAKLFKDSGAKYVIPVAEHHDGFPMYASEYTKWDASEMGPKRDVVADLAEAVREEGLHFGVSSHRAENWWFFDGGRKTPSDVQDDQYRDFYGPAQDREKTENGEIKVSEEFLDDWLLRTAELVDRFQPEVIWFDWWIARPEFQENAHLQAFSSYYYNKSSEWENMGAINYKRFGGESFPETAGVLDIERGGLADVRELYWQTDTSVSKTSWGYVTNHEYKTVNSLVDDLIDIVSKNGCMLLNIGPKADGTIPEEEQQMLLEMGEWLKVNGEAIYGTRAWNIYGEGPTEVVDGTLRNDAEHSRKEFNEKDIRFTTKGDKLYAIVMDWPGAEGVNIRALNKGADLEISSVELIGFDGALDWTQTASALEVQFPAKPTGKHAFVLVIQ